MSQLSIFDIKAQEEQPPVKKRQKKLPRKKKPIQKDFRKILDKIAAKGSDTRRVFDCFVKLSACALSNGRREKEYLEEVKRWKKEELSLFAAAFAQLIAEMEEEPFSDLLGPHYMEWALGRKTAQNNGEFHTPEALCQMMAQMTATPEAILSSVEEKGHYSVSEPSCGAGAMILAVGKSLADFGHGHLISRLRVTAVDVNKTSCDMCFINTSLWGIPCVVIHGNTLSLETWGEWRNIHFFRSDL